MTIALKQPPTYTQIIRRGATWGAIAALAAAGPPVFVQAAASWSWFGLDVVRPPLLFGSLVLPIFAFLAIFIVLVILPAALAGFVFFADFRRTATSYLAGALVFLLLALPLLQATRTVRRRVLGRLAARLTPLVEAIEQYEGRHGAAPDDLADLVPEFLPALPATEMAGYPDYTYRRFRADDRQEGPNGWALEVPTPYGLWLDFLYYLPRGTYGACPRARVVAFVGEWAAMTPVTRSNGGD